MNEASQTVFVAILSFRDGLLKLLACILSGHLHHLFLDQLRSATVYLGGDRCIAWSRRCSQLRALLTDLARGCRLLLRCLLPRAGRRGDLLAKL